MKTELGVSTSSRVVTMSRCSEKPGWSVCSVYAMVN